jgi:hypothetical protein
LSCPEATAGVRANAVRTVTANIRVMVMAISF